MRGLACLTLTLACAAPTLPAPSPRPPVALTERAVRTQVAFTVETVDASTQRPRVILLSIDGLHPRFLHRPDVYGLAIPHLRALLADGSMARSMKTVFPSLTYPAHVSMVTGVPPDEHGIDNNMVLDPAGDNKDGWHWYADRIRTPTVWTHAKRAGLHVASVYFPVTLGADIEWNVPQFWRAENQEDARLLHALIEPALRTELQEQGLTLPGEHTSDSVRARLSAYLLREKDPDLLLAYFEDLDAASHKHGPESEQALRTLEAVDRAVGTLREGTTGRPTTWVIVSDHGFARVDKRVRINVALKQAGLLGDAKRKIPPRVIFARSNAMCAFYLAHEGDQESQIKLETLLLRLARDPKNGVGRIYSRTELDARHAYPGAAVAVEALPGFLFLKSEEPPMVAPSEEHGAHGYDPDRPEMHATFILSGAGAPKGADLGERSILDVAPAVLNALGISK